MFTLHLIDVFRLISVRESFKETSHGNLGHPTHTQELGLGFSKTTNKPFPEKNVGHPICIRPPTFPTMCVSSEQCEQCVSSVSSSSSVRAAAREKVEFGREWSAEKFIASNCPPAPTLTLWQYWHQVKTNQKIPRMSKASFHLLKIWSNIFKKNIKIVLETFELHLFQPEGKTGENLNQNKILFWLKLVSNHRVGWRQNWSKFTF